MIEIEGYKYSYDYENRLVQVLYDFDEVIAEYAYDAPGRMLMATKYDEDAEGYISQFRFNYNVIGGVTDADEVVLYYKSIQFTGVRR